MRLSSAPVFVLFNDDAAAKLDLMAPPTPARWLDGKPSPAVLQALLPQSRVVLEESAYRVAQGKFDRIPIYVYNFGAEKVEGRLTLKGPKDWRPSLPESVSVAPGERIGLELTMDVPASAAGVQTIAVEGDFGPAGNAVLSMRFLPKPR